MRMTLLLIPLLVANAHAGDPVAVVQAQPLAQTPAFSVTGSPASVKAAAVSKAVIGPKIHETVATRNADGTLNIGCVERPNPRASQPPIRTPMPEAQQ